MQNGQGDNKRLRAFEDIFARPNAVRGPQNAPPNYAYNGYPQQPPVQHSPQLGYANYNNTDAERFAMQQHQEQQWRAQQEAMQQQRMSMYSQYQQPMEDHLPSNAYQSQAGPSRHPYSGKQSFTFPPQINEQSAVSAHRQSTYSPQPNLYIDSTHANDRAAQQQQMGTRPASSASGPPHRRTTGGTSSLDSSSLVNDPHLSAYFDSSHSSGERRYSDNDNRQGVRPNPNNLRIEAGLQPPEGEDYIVPSPRTGSDRPSSLYSGNSGSTRSTPNPRQQSFPQNHFESQQGAADYTRMSYYAPRPPEGPRPLPTLYSSTSSIASGGSASAVFSNGQVYSSPQVSQGPPTVVVPQQSYFGQRSLQHSSASQNDFPSDRSNSFTSASLSPVIAPTHSRRQSFPANLSSGAPSPMSSINSGQSAQTSHSRTQSGTVVPLPRGNSNRSQHQSPQQQQQAAASAILTASKRTPLVYPALLSKVAEAFKTRVMICERVKDGLTYKDAFDGREAVDKIAYIIKTTDRNLALLLGRALDAQKFFHDVTWEHRLRDSPYELYQFRERLTFVSSDDLAGTPDDIQSQDPHDGRSERPASKMPLPSAASSEPGSSDFEGGGTFTTLDRNASAKSMATMATSQFSEVTPDGYMSPEYYKQAGKSQFGRRPPSITDTILSDDSSTPSGIFTLLTDCYSPTCTRDRLCYSIACPRRLEQQARLKLKPQPGLKRSTSNESLGDLQEPGKLWIHSVPQDVADSTSDAEKRRQEAINEAIYTERDFLRDLEYVREKWIKGIRAGNFIPEHRKDDFIQQVFWNVLDIEQVSHRLCEHLTRRQKQSPVVSQIGDIYLDNVGNFGPFVQYGAHQLYGKYEFEKEKGSNVGFARFVDDTERLPESRKLELNAYLTKPTTRLARYPLLLEVVLKHTPEGHADKILLPKAIKIIRDFLSKVNTESGKSENRFNLAQLDTQIIFKPGEQVDLKLREESRELITKGPLKKRGGTQSESAELQVFLFDHALVMTKQKNKLEQYKVYRKPIPLELLIVSTIDEIPGRGTVTTKSRTLMARSSTSGKVPQMPAATQASKAGFAMILTHLGRRGYDITLWSPTWIGRKNWLDKIEARQIELRERSMVFDSVMLSEEYFLGQNRVTCAAPFDAGNRMVYGTDQGVYVSDLRDRKRVPIKVISVMNVTQVDVLDDHGILIVLADKAVQTFFVDSLDPSDAIGAAKRARKISSNASFFKTGICMGRTLVCIVKSGSVSSTIKTLEPIEQTRGKKQPAIRKLLQGSQDSLRVFKEFYLPNSADSVHFLKSKLCVGCAKGFEIVDLDTLDTQGLLDPADSSLDFAQKRENVRPIAIYRVEGEFLLCYDDFAFYVNKNGWRTKGNWLIQWEGRPTSFALHYPYVLAFEPTFIEVRQVDSGALMQIIPGNSIRCLYSDVPISSTASAIPAGYYGPHANNNGFVPQYGRHSTYGSQVPLPLRMPPRASQIIFTDNGHQVLKCIAAAPP